MLVKGVGSMLKLPNLDDRLFNQIVEEARKTIPKLTEDWTDENTHDPGITLIELFSWLTETQQYYINRITKKNELKYLKLLGIYPQLASSAKIEVSFSEVVKEMILPLGTKLLAQGQSFETIDESLLVPAQIEKIIVFSNGESVDMTVANENEGATYNAFGANVEKGNRFYLAFDRELPIQKEFSIKCSLFEDYPVPLQNTEQGGVLEIFPSSKVSWLYYGEKEDRTGEWLPLDILQDDTAHLSFSGHIKINIPQPMKPSVIHPANEKKRYWICCQLNEEGYETPPKIQNISLNTTMAKQRNTLSQAQTFSSNGKKDQEFVVKNYLDIYGIQLIQVREDKRGWMDWEERDHLSGAFPHDRVYQIVNDKEKKQVSVKFGNGNKGRVPISGTNNIRIISYMKSLEHTRWIGQSNGVPHQSFQILESQAGTNLQQLEIQVGQKEEPFNKWIWKDWFKVDNFDQSNPDDCHYMIDLEENKIMFSDHEHGRIPPRAERNNIRIVSLQFGGGEQGNIKSGVIDQVFLPDGIQDGEVSQLSVTNTFDASGGNDRETIEKAKKRLLQHLNKPTRTVTNEDFEEIARVTPGLRVARVKAIPLYVKGMQNYPENKAHGQITVVLVPYSADERPLPSQGFLQTAKRHLEKHRLITTEIHVIAPEYIKITVYAVVVVEPGFKNSKRIKERLHHHFNPLDQQESKGWTFGRSVFKGDIMGEMNRIPGVVFIQDLWLNGQGSGMKVDENGNISIPPHGLVYSGEHEITVISRTDI